MHTILYNRKRKKELRLERRSQVSYLDDISSHFFEFVHGPHVGHDIGENLATWLEKWVEYGNAVEITAGDYAVFLQAVISIMIQIETKGPMRFCTPDQFGEPPLFRSTGSAEEMGLPSRDLWNAQVFRRKYPFPAKTTQIGS